MPSSVSSVHSVVDWMLAADNLARVGALGKLGRTVRGNGRSAATAKHQRTMTWTGGRGSAATSGDSLARPRSCPTFWLLRICAVESFRDCGTDPAIGFARVFTGNDWTPRSLRIGRHAVDDLGPPALSDRRHLLTVTPIESIALATTTLA